MVINSQDWSRCDRVGLLIELAALFEQCREAMLLLARAGYAHGDLSAYNMHVRRNRRGPRLVLIDLPQVVDIAANSRGAEFLTATASTSAAGSAPADWTPPSSSTSSAT